MATKYSVALCMIAILLYLHVSVSQYSHGRLKFRRPRKMIIDTDAGGDDALALMLALMYEVKTHDIEILAITCTYGNAYLDNVTQNVLKTLTITNRSDVPVYLGSTKPLINSYKFDSYFGEDGFGDFNFTERITAKVDKTKHASELLVEKVRKYPDQITIVALGPLTNIAVAIALEPNFLNYAKQLVIMGASVPLEKDNNESPKIEFNFKQDPESNWIALNNTNKAHIVFPIDTVQKYSLSKEERRDLFTKLKPSFANFLSLAERIALNKTELWEPSDGMAMAVTLKPQIVTDSFVTNLVPILYGDARGAVEIDSNNAIHNARVIRGLNVTSFKNFVWSNLS